MSKPKNMTPEQEKAWRERLRLKRTDPSAKAKQKARFEHWYAEQGGREKVVANVRRQREAPEGRERRNALERENLRKHEELRHKAKERADTWRSTEEGAQKHRATVKRHYYRKRLDDQYEHFLANLEAEDVSCQNI